MKRCLCLLLFAACQGSVDHKNSDDNPLVPPLVIQSENYWLSSEDGLKIPIKLSPRLGLKEAEKSLFLLELLKEQASPEELAQAIPIYLSKNKNGNLIKTRSPLKEEQAYGLYLKQEKADASLLYAFAIKNEKVRLLDHDLGSKKPFLIEEGRLLFHFLFDQPVYFKDDNALSLTSLDPKFLAPVIESITIFESRVTLRLKKGEPGFHSKGQYEFRFSAGLKDAYGRSISIDPLSFGVRKSEEQRDQSLPIEFSSSHDSVEFSRLVYPEEAELYLIDRAQQENKAINSAARDLFKSDRLYVGGLRLGHRYDFIFRDIDERGEIRLAQGDFLTTQSVGLRFSELMIKPLVSSRKEEEGEYIELVNQGDKAINLWGIYLSTEDTVTKSIRHCPLVSESVLIEKNQHFLVVGSSFDASLYGLAGAQNIIRLKQQSICGGLANQSSKIMKLHRKDGHFIDRFSASLPMLAGSSIQRIDIMGLDESRNYCYSAAGSGPSPGKVNGPCNQF